MSLGNGSSDGELAGVLSEEKTQPVEVPSSSWWSRLWGRDKQQERFVIKSKWAVEIVKATSWPLEIYVHPDWALTDAEAAEAASEMHIFLQAVADRYVPLIIARFASRHSELFDLCMALSLMYYHKARVMNAEIARNKPGKPVAVMESKAMEATSDEIAHPESATGPQDVLCESCETVFPNAAEAAKHLPCPGKPNGKAS